MRSNNAAMEAALLEIAKDLLQASDDLASTDPAASAKLAHEAYEIGRDLGIVRNHLDDKIGLANALGSSTSESAASAFEPRAKPVQNGVHQRRSSQRDTYRRRDVEEDSDADLARILDRQKAMLPKPVELAPVKKPSRGTRSLTFESAQPRRSGLFGWMRPREWRPAS